MFCDIHQYGRYYMCMQVLKYFSKKNMKIINTGTYDDNIKMYMYLYIHILYSNCTWLVLAIVW